MPSKIAQNPLLPPYRRRAGLRIRCFDGAPAGPSPVGNLAVVSDCSGDPLIIRKNSYGNRSDRGADTQAMLMSIYRTLKQRGHDPLKTITNGLAEYLKTGKLPSLPP